MRLIILAAISLSMTTFAGSMHAQPWQNASPASAGWSIKGLQAAQDYAASLKPTAVMVVQDGKVVVSWGNVSRKVNVVSVRKSLLSALYGIVVSEGRVNLDRTLDDLGIDDKRPAFTEIEKQVTVRDLVVVQIMGSAQNRRAFGSIIPTTCCSSSQRRHLDEHS